jgi:hypothetical protein
MAPPKSAAKSIKKTKSIPSLKKAALKTKDSDEFTPPASPQKPRAAKLAGKQVLAAYAAMHLNKDEVPNEGALVLKAPQAKVAGEGAEHGCGDVDRSIIPAVALSEGADEGQAFAAITSLC